MRSLRERRAARVERDEAAAEAWHEALSSRSVLKDITAANRSLTGTVINDPKAAAIVRAQVANSKATLLVAQRLDRIIELLEASADDRNPPPRRALRTSRS